MVSAALNLGFMDILWFKGCNIFLDDFLLSYKLELCKAQRMNSHTVCLLFKRLKEPKDHNKPTKQTCCCSILHNPDLLTT